MTPESATAVLEASAAIVAIARLLYLQLAGTFPALVCFLSVVAVSATAGSFLPPTSQTYFWLYTAQTPVYCVLALLAGRELFSVVFIRYPGIRTAGKSAMYWCAGFASFLSVLIALGHWGPAVFFTRLVYIELARRSIVLSVALFILLILYSLSRYPLSLGRNVLISSSIFSVFFLSQAVELLIDSFSTNLYSRDIDLASVIFGAACTLAWAALLRKEPVKVPVIVKFSSEDEEHLLRELDNLNRLLTRAAHR